MPTRRREFKAVRTALATTTVLCLLVACGPGAGPVEPRLTPSVSESVAPEPTPTPTVSDLGSAEPLADGVAPARPIQAEGEASGDAAIAVLQYYLQLVPYALNTGDVDALRELSHPDCAFCSSVLETRENLVAQQLHSEGGGVTFEAATVFEVTPGYWYHVEFVMHEAAARDVDALGNVVTEYEAASHKIAAIALYENGAWVIHEVSHDKLTP